MYEYTWYQWLCFFYLYCFFGWIFESSYVSLKEKRLVNRGFLRLPMLPLYGTGAVMMLWVSLPVQDNLLFVYLSGVAAATALEYVTGWGMERLFKVKYWDYSSQKFNLNGYICLTSSIAWGFLTLFLTEVIHKPIEHWVLGLSEQTAIIVVSAVTLCFVYDTVQSVRAALSLAKVLDAMTRMRTELEDIQVQMALLRDETGQRLEDVKEEAAQKLESVRTEAATVAGWLVGEAAERAASLRDGAVERAASLRDGAAERAASLRDGAVEQAAFLKDEALFCAQQFKTGTAKKAMRLKDEAMLCKDTGEERIRELSRRVAELARKRQHLALHMDFYRKGILRGNPTASSVRFGAALKELRQIAEKRKRK